MIDQKAMAYVNTYGVLRALENVCELVPEAKKICEKMKKPVALCLDVKDGPCVTYKFDKNGCKFVEGDAECTCKMSFKNCEALNNLVNNSTPGIPTKNPVEVLAFLLGPFTKLTNIMSKYLQPEEADLKDPEFFRLNTILTMYVIGGAVCALANHDEISKISASGMVDGKIQMGIKDACYVTIISKDQKLSLVKEKPENPRAVMEFSSIELANGLFNGTVSTIAELCAGNIKMAGMISMLDNVNRILDRVAVYLG